MEEELNAPKTLAVDPGEKALGEGSGFCGLSESPTGSLSVLVEKNGGSDDANDKDNGVSHVVVSTVACTENCLEKSPLLEDGVGVGVESEVHVVSDSVESQMKLQNNGSSVRSGTSLSELGLIECGDEKIGVEEVVMEEEKKDCPMSPLNGVEVLEKTEPGSPLDGVESPKKVEVSGDGILLLVQDSGPASGVISDNPNEEKCSGLKVDDQKEKESENKGGEAIDNQECKFSVGDLVWVRTKNESWWPGKIYDPKDASKYGAMCSLEQSCLVGYFGNGEFDWCSPSQLKPLHEDFKKMSGESESKSFVGAIEKAVNEIGRHVKLEMTCSCILKKTRTELPGPLADNPGVKEELSVPKHKIFDFVALFEPAKLLAYLKNLSQVVSMPDLLELAVLKNHLSAFYRSVGHCQLSMHQIPGMNDMEESAQDELTARGNVDQIGGKDQDGFGKTPSTALEKESENLEDEVSHTKKTGTAEISGQDIDVLRDNHRGDVAGKKVISNVPVSKTRKRKKRGDSEARKACHEAKDAGILASSSEEAGFSRSPTTMENKGSNAADGDGETGTKYEKGVESRERKKSKYLSPPYIKLNWGRKGPVLEDAEAEDLKVSKVSCDGEGMNEASEQLGVLPPLVSGKTQKKRFRKSSDENDTSGDIGVIDLPSSVVLSEIRCAAADCLYPCKTKNFGSIERFFQRFRCSTYSEVAECKMYEKNVSGDKEALPAEPNSLQKRFLEIKPSIKPERKKRKKKGKVTLKDLAELTAGIPDDSGNHVKSYLFGKDPAGDELTGVNGHVHNMQEMIFQSPKGKRGRRVMKNKEGTNPKGSKTKPNPGLLDVNVGIVTSSSLINDSERLLTVGIPDLNGNSPIPNPSVEDLHVMSTVALEGTLNQNRDMEFAAAVNGSFAKHCPRIKALSGMGLHSFGVIPELNGKFTMSLPEVNGNITKFSLVTEDSIVNSQLMPGGKLKPRKRKRKENATKEGSEINSTASIPDLNGNSAEQPNSTEKPLPGGTSKVKPPRKRRRRKEVGGGMLDMNINYKVVNTAEDVGTTLTLTFAQGSSMPSKETLVEAFLKFGPLKESETKVLTDPLYAQVVFIRDSDAREAVRSLEKCSPFGPALVNYQLNHSPAAASLAVEQNTNQQIIPFSQPLEALKTLARPPSGEVPPLFYIRQDLEMMTAMLAKSGDELSPDMRAKLEGEIKGLLKKVSTMAGSSASS